MVTLPPLSPSISSMPVELDVSNRVSLPDNSTLQPLLRFSTRTLSTVLLSPRPPNVILYTPGDDDWAQAGIGTNAIPANAATHSDLHKFVNIFFIIKFKKVIYKMSVIICSCYRILCKITLYYLDYESFILVVSYILHFLLPKTLSARHLLCA